MKQSNEQTDFEEDIVSKVISDVLEVNFQVDKPIYVDQINEFSHNIVDEIIKELLKLKKLFKYSVTVFCQQKNGSAMNFGGAYHIEDSSDGVVTVTVSDHPHVDLMISVAGFKITQK